MRNHLASAFLVLILAAPASSALPLDFTPPLPDSDDRIEIHFVSVCGSVCSVAGVTSSIAGRVITINVALQGGILPAVTAFEGKAKIGPLAPGSYLVRVVFSDPFSMPPLERELIVVESDPPFVVRPFAARKGEMVTLIADPVRAAVASCDASRCSPANIRINGVPVLDAQATRSDLVHVRVPDLPPGLYDVDVVLPTRQSRAAAAIRVFDSVKNDDPAFERILVPSALRAQGAFGSEWRTDIFVRNPTAHRIPIIGVADVDSGNTRNVSERLPNDDRGAFLRIDRGSAPSAALAGFVRDVSRDGARWGVELPLVREEDFRGERVHFAAVPLDRNARATLRIYALDVTSAGYGVIIAGTTNEILHQLFVNAVTADETRPAFASVNLGALGLQDQTVTITIYPTSGSSPSLFARFWAFITVTNNDTQHVTIITPQ